MTTPTTDSPATLTEKHLLTWDDWSCDGYVVRWWGVATQGEYNNHAVNFDVVEIYGRISNNDGSDGPRLYRNKDDVDTDNIEEATALADGFIKWDGCSHISFNTQECMHHLCGRKAWVAFGLLMTRIFDEVATKIPRLDRRCAGFTE